MIYSTVVAYLNFNRIGNKVIFKFQIDNVQHEVQYWWVVCGIRAPYTSDQIHIIQIITM